MAIRDAIVLNTTGSNFEALQSGDTVRIKGDSSKLLSVENSSATSIFSVGTSNTSLVIEGNITSSKLISGSSTSTASFGRFVAATFDGDGRELVSTLPRSAGLVSGSAQIRGDVSGSFTSGFTFGATANQLYVGVSGSNSSHSASISGSTRGMAASGSDSTPLKIDEIGHIRGTVGAGTFTAGAALINARNNLLGAGIQNAALAFGGYAVGNVRNKTEHYDGTSWSAGGDLVRSHQNGNMGAGWGVEYAAIKTGGNGPGLNCTTEVYNGTSWSEIQDKTVAQCCGGGAGTQNAGVSFGGNPSPNTTEHWNGTSWSTGGTMITGGDRINCGAGLENAALVAGVGGSPTDGTCSEEYNGTAWSAGGILGDKKARGTTTGTQNAAIVMNGLGGTSDAVALHYDGASWSTGGTSTQESFDLASSAGLQSAALKFGGQFPARLSCTEEYNANYTNTGSFGRIVAGYILGSGEDIKGQIPRDAGLVTGSAQLATDISGSFTSGFNFGHTFESRLIGISGSSPTPGVSGSEVHYSSSVGHPTDIDVSGATSGSDYDIFANSGIRGSVINGTWTSGGTMITARSKAFKGASGLENAAIVVGSGPSEYSNDGPTEKYDGTSWSADGSALNTALRFSSVTGTQNAALSVGGLVTWTSKRNVEIYNGNVWTAAEQLPETSGSHIVYGTVNAASAVGMQTRDSDDATYVYNFDGTSWSTPSVNVEIGVTGPSISGTHNGIAGGSQNSGFLAGAQSNPAREKTFTFDGTTFTQVANLNLGRTNLGGWGTANTALVVGGVTPGSTSKTELWDGTTWSETTDATNAGGRGGGSAGNFADAGISTPGTGYTEHWDGQFSNSGSFGRIEVTYFDGDATSISGSLADSAGVKTSSEGFQSEITGSIRGGISLKGPLTSQPVGAWSQVASSRVGGSQHVLIGNKNSAIKVGGGYYTPTAEQDATERYDGIAWSDFVRLPHTFTRGEASGQVDSELVYGGIYSGSSGLNVTLSGNGTSFNQEAYMVDYGQNRSNQKGGNIGIQNAALATTNNHLSPGVHKTQVYDGNSWSILPSHANANSDAGHASTGVVNAAILTGGSGRCKCSEIWDGTSWGVGPSLIQGKCAHAIAGGVNDAITIGSYAHPAYPQMGSCTQLWDGVAWSSTAAAGLGFHNRGDSNLNSSDGAISHGGHTDSRNTYVWDTHYVTSGSFWKVEPKYGIETERFELKGKFVNDENTLVLLQSNTVNDSVNISGSMGDTSYTASLGNYHSASFVLDAKHTGSAGLITDAHPPKFGRSSFYMDGSGGITISGSADGRAMNELAFGTGDFTVEYWVRFDDITTSTYQELVDFRQAANSETQITIYTDGSGGYPADLRYYIAGADRIDVANILKDDVWQHHALVRYDGVTTLYIDGKPRGTYADTNNITVAPNAIHFGRHFNNNTNDLHGQMDTIRVSNIARYTVPFIPEEGEIERFASGSITHSPYTPEKIESTTFKLPQFSNFDQPAILTQTLFQTNFSSSLSAISGSRRGRSGSGVGKYGYEEENIGTVAGDMWFNRENNSLNFTWESSSYSGGVWSVGGAMMIAKEWPEGAGVANAAVVFGGHNHPTNCTTEHYDGAAWTRGGDQISSKSYFASAGIQNAALAFGGNPSNTAEHYNGAVWSAGGTPGCDRYSNAGTGRENAALNFGGEGPTADTEEYNGTSWSEGGNLNTARRLLSGAGEQYATLAIGGGTPVAVACTEEYNGSVWAVATALPATRFQNSAGGGVGDAWMAGGGNPSLTGATLEWNGSTWNTGGTLNTNKNGGAGDGFAGNAFVAGGTAPAAIANTEEYDGSGVYKNLVVCALTGSQA